MDRFTQRVVLGIAVLAGASSVVAQDRVVLKSSRVLTGTVVRDTRSEVEKSSVQSENSWAE